MNNVFSRAGLVLGVFAVMALGYIGALEFPIQGTPAAVANIPTYTMQLYSNTTLSGDPVYTSTVHEISSKSFPADKIANGTFSVRWRGTISVAEAATYQFFANSRDGIRIWIDDDRVLSRWSDQIEWDAFTVNLSSGQHTIKVEYYQQGKAGAVSVRWNPIYYLSLPQTQSGVTYSNPNSGGSTNTAPGTGSSGGSGSTVVVFITGGGMDANQAALLQREVSAFYQPKLPQGTPWYIIGYDSNVKNLIEARYPGRKVILVGHSFGGNAAVNAAKDLANPIELMILLDPVHIASSWKPEDFSVPSNVKKAVAYRRQYSDGQPGSGLISNPRPQDQNIVYPMDANRRKDAAYIAEMHGWPVWQQSVIDLIKNALSSSNASSGTGGNQGSGASGTASGGGDGVPTPVTQYSNNVRIVNLPTVNGTNYPSHKYVSGTSQVCTGNTYQALNIQVNPAGPGEYAIFQGGEMMNFINTGAYKINLARGSNYFRSVTFKNIKVHDFSHDRSALQNGCPAHFDAFWVGLGHKDLDISFENVEIKNTPTTGVMQSILMWGFVADTLTFKNFKVINGGPSGLDFDEVNHLIIDSSDFRGYIPDGNRPKKLTLRGTKTQYWIDIANAWKREGVQVVIE